MISHSLVVKGVVLACILQCSGRQINNCAGVQCRPAPESNCREVASRSGVQSCCPDFECVRPDGTVSRYSGMGASQTSEHSTSYVSPDGSRHSNSHSSSSYSSSSSSSNNAAPGAGGNSFDSMNNMQQMYMHQPQGQGAIFGQPGLFQPMMRGMGPGFVFG